MNKDEHASPPAVDPSVRLFATRLRERLKFSSEGYDPEMPRLVGWLDVMGASHLMTTSIQRSANAIARVQMAVELATVDHGSSVETLPINDGVFILAKRRSDFIPVLRDAMGMLAGNFIARPNNLDRFLVRGSVAYGPVYKAAALLTKKQQKRFPALERALFGAPLAQAHHEEKSAAVFGYSVHESARSFHPAKEEPFKAIHWRWWDASEQYGGLDYIGLKNLLRLELVSYFDYLKKSRVYQGVKVETIKEWESAAESYFF